MPRDVSPAAAAGVSRILTAAGFKRAVEFRKGVEFEGFWAEPHGDHVRVDYTPGFDVDPTRALDTVIPKLQEIGVLLKAKGYRVKPITVDAYVYGGNEPIGMVVIEVRKPEWTRRDTDA